MSRPGHAGSAGPRRGPGSARAVSRHLASATLAAPRRPSPAAPVWNLAAAGLALFGALTAAPAAAAPQAGEEPAAPAAEDASPPAAAPTAPPLADGETGSATVPAWTAGAHHGIEVDGRIGAEEWAGAAAVPVPWEWFPSDNEPAPVATEVLVASDGERLYVAFRADDPRPAEIRAHLSDRDAVLRDDVVGFEIDTFNDRRRAYRFQANPLGVQLDAQVSDVDDSEDLSWDAIWDSAGRITERGYEVEIAVPFKQLRVPRTAAAQTWGFLAYRDYPRSVVHELKSTRHDRDLDCRVCQFGEIQGLVGLETGYNLEVVPTVTADRTDERPALAGPIDEGDEDVEAGLTARWSVSPNVALHLTVNPDFSQVEADAAQLDVNERFALFFPEKRPFFLAGADFFSTPFAAVFTRTVADPEYGLKLTGKDGPHAFGVFAAEDRLNNLLLPGPEASSFAFLDDDVTSGVVRYRRDVGRTSTLGFLYAGRDGASAYENHVYGADGNLRLTDSDTLRVQALGSSTEYPRDLALARGQPAGGFDGVAYRADWTRSTRDWFFRGFHASVDDEFRADSGFMPRVGYRETFGIAERIFWGEPDHWFRQLKLHASAVRLERKTGGDLIEQGGNFELLYRGPLQSLVRLGVRPNEEAFQGETFDNLRGDLTVQVRPSGDLAFELFLRGGEIIDFVNVRQADFRIVRPLVEFKLGRRVTGSVQHEWQELEVAQGGGRFLTANLSQGRLIYHFNVRTFVRAILQYRDVERRLELYEPGVGLAADEEELFSQLLFSYKLNPQTVLLAGYSDLYLGDRQVDLTQASRTFFVKLGYAFLW